MTKKISMNDLNHILDRRPYWFDFILEATIKKKENGSYCVTCQIRKFWFIILLPLTAALEFISCMWNDGLRNFCLPTRFLGDWFAFNNEKGLGGRYDCIEKIWGNA